MTTFNWQVVDMNRLTSDDFVVTVHYNVSATDGTFQASTYGTTSYTQAESESFLPYASLTEAIVVGWVQNTLGKDTVEASLQSQIDAQINPVEEAGVPWAV